MSKNFRPDALPLLIGSLPISDHEEAIKLILDYTPQIPLWAQLPVYKEEGMMNQFAPGLPGLVNKDGDVAVDISKPSFDEEVLAFYEEYMEVSENKKNPDDSRFSLKPDTAKGFSVFMEHVKKLSPKPVALKGQVTGPITFCTGVKDENGQAIFYNEQLRDAAVKLLALKGAWQAREFKKTGAVPIIFFDEPVLAGLGSSEYISISNEDVAACFKEVIDAVHEQGGLVGIHVCANTDWSILLDSSVDIINFDAYSYFDKFILYAEKIKTFLESGRIIAWGIVPTLNPSDIEKEDVKSLLAQLEEKFSQIDALGIDRAKLLSQSLICPSCGTGSISLEHATRVLELTKELSICVRNG
ncbi:hypothetical protein QUF76_11920 [Desulfobacterales bacterium HSG16]|nr:hypothetical protein [Desulfobacterales bacterium HSG16]